MAKATGFQPVDAGSSPAVRFTSADDGGTRHPLEALGNGRVGYLATTHAAILSVGGG